MRCGLCGTFGYPLKRKARPEQYALTAPAAAP